MEKDLHNVIIIGGGISAHTAAIYNARAELKPLVLSGIEPDQLSLTTEVENWPGDPEGVMGPELVADAKKQAEKFGAKYVMEKAEKFEPKDGYYEITTGKNTYQTRAVIISTGAHAKRLNIPGEDEYFGKGVSTCAVCDAAFYRGKKTVVIGGGDSAMEEASALHKFADKVTIIHRSDAFSSASKAMQNRIFNLKEKENKIDIMWNTEALEVLGDGKFVTGAKVKNNQTDETQEIKTDGFFLAIGHLPNVEIFKDHVELDDFGYIKTDKLQQTNLPGVFAAGDVQDRIFKQAVTSAGAGCAAAISAEKYIEELKDQGKY